MVSISTHERMNDMLELQVPDMSCDHCVATITKTVRALDGDATVKADLGSQTVSIDSRVDRQKITVALEEAGYPATVR